MMETLRAFFQIGSVECVTCQVPRSQGREGAANAVALEGVLALVVVGARRDIWGWVVDGAGCSEDDMLFTRKQGSYVQWNFRKYWLGILRCRLL